MENNQTPTYPDRYDYEAEEERILRKLVAKLNKIRGIIWLKKYWIIGSAIAMASLFLAVAFFKDPTYEAILTYMIEEEDAGSLGSIASVLGQFGLGGVAGGEDQNLEKISTLAQSRKILHPVLLEQHTLDGTVDFIANHIINIYELQEKWENDTLLNSFYFTHADFDSFTKKERLGLKKVYDVIVGNEKAGIDPIMKTGFAVETKILYINITALNESLAIHLTESIYDKLSKFYIEETTKNPKQTFDIISQRADSILLSLTDTQKKLAYLEAKSTERVTHDDRIRKKILSRDLQILTLMYGEVIKTKETSGFLLKNETPFFQVLDEPFSPIEPEEPSFLLALLLGSVLGGGVATTFFVSRAIYSTSLMSNEKIISN